MSTNKLRLGPLPKTEPVKLTITLPAELKATLDRYAALHAQTYGEPVDAAALVPYMLEAFMARDRAFRKGATKRTPAPVPPKLAPSA
jgi:hypothetical protein